MGAYNVYPIVFVVWLVVTSFGNYVTSAQDHHGNLITYIVHMEVSSMQTTGFVDHLEWYESTLKAASRSATMLYVYNEVIHGFSARLTPHEAETLKRQVGVLHLREETRLKLHTTRTPTFLGLEEARKSKKFPSLKSESDVIVGVIDSGVWPELDSFTDTGLGPVRSSWRGQCEQGTNFSSSHCNKKLVGARYFCKGYEAHIGRINETNEYRSPRDSFGHGTHTSTTAAGSPVHNASLFGYANGTAMGMAAHARIAIYKIFWHETQIFESDFFAAFEKAIWDGVDVISLSFGLRDGEGYDADAIAIASFTAIAKGIVVSCAVGNDGPNAGTITNDAPWTIGVGASTLDRDFPAYVTLGNGNSYTGISLHDSGKGLPSPKAGVANFSSVSETGTLIPRLVSGKILIFDIEDSTASVGLRVKRAGGVGVIITNTKRFREEIETLADFAIPSIAVGQIAGDAIKEYVMHTEHPTAILRWGYTRLNVQPSPKVVQFSSRGPSERCAGVLKPDLIAPGLNVLAGWIGNTGPTSLDYDNRRVDFNVMSGTSMACPHIAGVAALVKAAHPTWSAAAIKSALMTTAYDTYDNGKPFETDDFPGAVGTPFDYGAGQVNPLLALSPGLVYDNTVNDYLDFLCALNYSSHRIKLITNENYKCKGGKTNGGNLNYPSFSVPIPPPSATTKKALLHYSRTLTNVGDVPSTYKLVRLSLRTKDIKVKVKPQVLTFTKLYDKKTYNVTFTATTGLPPKTTSSGHLVWSDGRHKVTSQIAFIWGK